ncbi:MAG: hypothetical protein WKF57_07680 [Nakamurella sp.]
MAAEFVPQVINTAMFLFENGIDIRLIQVCLYRMEDRKLVLTRSQLLPESGHFTTAISYA